MKNALLVGLCKIVDVKEVMNQNEIVGNEIKRKITYNYYVKNDIRVCFAKFLYFLKTSRPTYSKKETRW